jgi:hypothetical protein
MYDAIFFFNLTKFDQRRLSYWEGKPLWNNLHGNGCKRVIFSALPR